MLRHARRNVKVTFVHGRMKKLLGATISVKLVLRNKEDEVKAGMALLDALKKCDIVPESVIATRNGELITEDELLIDGETIKLIAVISGG